MGQIGTFLPFILMFVVMYLFMILPQQKKIKKEKDKNVLANNTHFSIMHKQKYSNILSYERTSTPKTQRMTQKTPCQ